MHLFSAACGSCCVLPLKLQSLQAAVSGNWHNSCYQGKGTVRHMQAGKADKQPVQRRATSGRITQIQPASSLAADLHTVAHGVAHRGTLAVSTSYFNR
jgi:hypothetical protein